MILEVVRADGARTWHRLTALPLSVGRGLTNDVVLDDPYVDGRHARVACDESGVLSVEDLGSVNGLVTADARVRGRLAVRAGTELRVGRTTLRFHDADEPVPPALVDEPAAPAAALAAAPTAPPPLPHADAAPGTRRAADAPARWVPTTRARLAVVLAALGAFALNAWLGNTERSGVSTALGVAFGFLAVAAVWAGLWAVASRAVTQRFHFTGHLAVVSAVAVGMLGAALVDEWVSFVFPGTEVGTLLSAALMLALVASLVAGHLSLSSTMPRRRRWRAGLAAAGGIVAIAGVAALGREDTFTDVPKFPSALKPIAPEWLPTTTVDEFAAATRALKDEVDRAAEEGTGGRTATPADTDAAHGRRAGTADRPWGARRTPRTRRPVIGGPPRRGTVRPLVGRSSAARRPRAAARRAR